MVIVRRWKTTETKTKTKTKNRREKTQNNSKNPHESHFENELLSYLSITQNIHCRILGVLDLKMSFVLSLCMMSCMGEEVLENPSRPGKGE